MRWPQASGLRSGDFAASRSEEQGSAPSSRVIPKQPKAGDRFRGFQTKYDIMQDLLQREQQASEEVNDYIHHMRQLASRFQKYLRDRELVKIINRGLKESV
ncbi:hypothetical protein ACLKA7_007595 [Drosophila subpalustris]